MRVLSIPAEHPYTQAIRPAHVEYEPDPDVDGNWWPHPALSAQYWNARSGDANASLPDLVHVHFGFEHYSPAEIQAMVDALPVPLVVTVHDIDNPHLEDQREHHERLRILLRRADAVVTLTDAAAAVLRADFGVENAVVLGHPQIASPVFAQRESRAAVFVKSLRGNVVSDPQFYRDLAARVPLDVYVHDVEATAHLRAALADANLRLHVHKPLADVALHKEIARATVCVLPYTRGTHSGWLEMCRDQGTNVAVPDVGYYAGQADIPEAVAVYRAGNGSSAGEAAAALVARGPVPYAGDRDAQLERIQAAHWAMYQDLLTERQDI